MRYLISVLFFLVTLSLAGQTTNTDLNEKMEIGKTTYYIKDGNFVFGGALVDGGDILNSQYCQIKQLNDVVRYSANEVSEYGFSDGRTYYSKTIEINDTLRKVFVFKMLYGKNNLYIYKSTKETVFFISKNDSDLIRIPGIRKQSSKSYHDFLLKYTEDCPKLKDGAMNVTYTQLGLKRFVKAYSECKPIFTPYFKYGFFASLQLNKLEIPNNISPNNTIRNFTLNYIPTLSPGFFVDLPLFSSDISLHSEISIFKNGYSNTKDLGYNKIYFAGNETGVNIPLLIRYIVPFLKTRPFVNVGVSYLYQWNVNSTMFSSTESDNSIVMVYLPPDTPEIANEEFGLSIGAGIEIPVTSKHAVSLELRYNNYEGLNSIYHFNKTSLSLIASYNF